MKNIFGFSAIILGFILGVAGVSFAGKPSNAAINLDPIEALSVYFFSFAWVGGTVGTIIGIVVLLGYLALCYFIGIKVYAAIFSVRD